MIVYILANYMTSWIKIPPADAVECCLIIENFVQSLMCLGSRHFGPLQTNDRAFKIESHYSINDGRGPHYYMYIGRGVVSSFFFKK